MTRLTKSDLLQIGVDLANGDHVKSSVWARLLAQHEAALDVVEACNVRHWEAAITCLRDNDMTGSAEDLAAVVDALSRFDADADGSRP